MADWMPKSARPYRPASAEPDVSGVESFARGAYQGAGMGFADEQAGALDAIGGHLKRTATNDWKRTGGGWWDDIKAELDQVAGDYRKGRDESRQAYSEAQEANPTAYGVGQFGGAVGVGLATGGASALGRAGLKGALTAGALEGAAGGLGGSEADLTHADLDAYAKAFRDSTEGGITGAGLAGGLYGAGKGVKWVGGKAVGALRGARAELETGVSAEREAADTTARAAEDKAARAEGKRAAKEARDAARAKSQQQKEFRAANERTQVDKRYAGPDAAPPPRSGGRPARQPPSADEFQFTEDQLAGFRRQAQGAVAERLNKGRGFRADLENPDLTARRKGFAQQYLDNYDVSDPRAAADAEFRQNLALNLGKRGYSADEIQRIVERYAPSAEPGTQAADLGDAFRQGRGPEVARQGGGGSAFGQDYPADARTVSDVVPEGWDPSAPRSGDPASDAKTEFGLAYMGKTADEPGLIGGVDQYRFIDPKSNRPYQLEAFSDPRKPGQVSLEYVGPDDIPADKAMGAAYGAQRNQVGPGVMRKVFRDLRERYPDANRVTSERMTGWNGNRDIDMAIPGQRQALQTQPVAPEVTQRMDLGDAVRQGRGDIARMGGGGSAWQDYGPEGRTISDMMPGREAPVSGDDLRQWLDLTQETRGGAPDALPPLEDITNPGAPSFPSDVRLSPVFAERPSLRPEYQPRPPEPRPVFDEAMAERRAMGANAQAGAGGMPTRNLGPARPAPAYDPNASMASPRDFAAETAVPLGETQVPRAPRPAPYAGPVAPELSPEPVLANPLRQARPRPLAPPVEPPAQTTMGAPPGSLVRQARQSVEEVARGREQGAMGGLVRAGWEGARSANNALAAPFGAAYGIGKEALENPAVRARAITAFRLDRLARVRPEVWARVGPTLQRAFQTGPERFKAERHVLLLRDPEFRAAEAEADAELERADGQPPMRRAAGR